jgi:hypothetical protein
MNPTPMGRAAGLLDFLITRGIPKIMKTNADTPARLDPR